MTNYQEYYEKSMEELRKYICEKKEVPTEKIWNQYAIEKGYLTSQTIGYLEGMKFPDLCKKIYKELKPKRKKQKVKEKNKE